MAISLKLDRRFGRIAKGRIEKYAFEVGILKDAPHKRPKSKKAGIKSFAGGPSRKISPKSGKTTIAEVSRFVRKLRKINYLIAPFQRTTGKNKDIINFTNEFFRYAFGRSQEKRLINLLQAIVRNPILRKDYGTNKKKTVQTKGFNRFMIDTGQLFKSITARVVKRV